MFILLASTARWDVPTEHFGWWQMGSSFVNFLAWELWSTTCCSHQKCTEWGSRDRGSFETKKNHGGLSSASDISSLLYSWKLLLLFSPLHVKTSGGELLQCICSEIRLEALHDLPRSPGSLVITGFTILPVTTSCIYLSCSSDKATDGIDIKAVLLNSPCTF